MLFRRVVSFRAYDCVVICSSGVSPDAPWINLSQLITSFLVPHLLHPALHYSAPLYVSICVSTNHRPSRWSYVFLSLLAFCFSFLLPNLTLPLLFVLSLLFLSHTVRISINTTLPSLSLKPGNSQHHLPKVSHFSGTIYLPRTARTPFQSAYTCSTFLPFFSHVRYAPLFRANLAALNLFTTKTRPGIPPLLHPICA